MAKVYHVKTPDADIEPHEVFLDKMAKAREEEWGISEKKFEVPLRASMPYVLMAVFVFCATVLLSRTFYFDVVQGRTLKNIAENNKGGTILVKPERGIIYDRNLKKLVSNASAFDFVCDKRSFSSSSPEIYSEIQNIAEALNKSPAEVQAQLEDSEDAEITLAENIGHTDLLVLETKMQNFPGCAITQSTMRDYLYADVFSHILGYTSRISRDEYANSTGYTINDYIGKTGLEKYYESWLRGKPGEMKAAKNALGQEGQVQIVKQPEPGYNLVLNIDAQLQQKLFASLEQRIKDVGAKRGAAVAMDPRTGAVLALVSYPSYDDNLFAKGISQADFSSIQNNPDQPLFDRAIAAKYPTGSTIKPFEAAAALQEKLISPTKQINDIGYILVHSQYDPAVTYKYGGVTPHGWVDMKKALAVSSNIYFYTVGGGYEGQAGLGPTRIKKYLSLFGWNEKTGVDLPGEFGGLIPDPEWKKRVRGQGWWNGDTYNLSIGQSDLQTTPLQVAAAYCAVANGGTLYKPQIVRSIVGPLEGSQQPIKTFAPEVVRSGFIDAENLQIVREGMRDGVTKDYGLSKYLNDLPVSAAAKTGTAEIGVQGKFNLWSAAFAPYENPEIVLVVTVESVKGFGSVTLPVAKDTLKWYFSGKK